jgi:hypothetical protein
MKRVRNTNGGRFRDVRFSAGELLTYLIIISIVAAAGGKWFMMQNTVGNLEAKTVIYETQFEIFGGAVDTLKTDVRQLKSDIGDVKITVHEIAKTMNGRR